MTMTRQQMINEELIGYAEYEVDWNKRCLMAIDKANMTGEYPGAFTALDAEKSRQMHMRQLARAEKALADLKQKLNA